MRQKSNILRVALSLPFFCLSLFCVAQHPGTLDQTFGDGGSVILSLSNGADAAEAVAIQADQKIVVVGRNTQASASNDFAVIRLNTDGSLDPSWGNNGIVSTDIQSGSDDGAYDLAIQPDGKIVVGGYSDNGTERKAALVRYKTDGTLDFSFGALGKVLTNFVGSDMSEIRALKLDAVGGRVVVCGTSALSSTFSKAVIARYLPNGALDNTFNNSGVSTFYFPTYDTTSNYVFADVSILPNGKIGAGGWRESTDPQIHKDRFYCQVKENGTRDSLFNQYALYGIIWSPISYETELQSLLAYDDNGMLLAGAIETHNTFTLPNYRMFGQKWDTTGTPQAFGTFFHIQDLIETIFAITKDNDGYFITAGVQTDGGAYGRFLLTRLDSTFRFDSNFGIGGSPDFFGGGCVTSQFGNSSNGAYDVAVQANNQIVAVGYTGNDAAIARYNNYNVALLDSFHLELPVDSQQAVSPSATSFEWTDAVGAVYYQVQLDTLPDFSSPAMGYHSVYPSSLLLSSLDTNTTYYWRVRATNEATWSAWSETWQFTTDTTFGVWVGERSIAELKVYPNPANEMVMISGVHPGDELRVVDAVGRLVHQREVQSSSPTINLDGIEQGSYFIIVSNSESARTTPLVVLKK